MPPLGAKPIGGRVGRMVRATVRTKERMHPTTFLRSRNDVEYGVRYSGAGTSAILRFLVAAYLFPAQLLETATRELGLQWLMVKGSDLHAAHHNK